MRSILLLLFILLFNQVSFADKLYLLDKDLGEYAISLIIHDDATFEMTATTKYGQNITVIPVAYGYHHAVDSNVLLNDVLWGNKFMLLKKAKGNYLVNEGFAPFNWKVFVFKQNYKHTISDTSSFTNEAIFATRAERTLKDSIINADIPKSPVAFVMGSYQDAAWTVTFSKNNLFSYSLGNNMLIEGTWKQKGIYLILTEKGNNLSYVCKVKEASKIEVIYLPLQSHGKLLARNNKP